MKYGISKAEENNVLLNIGTGIFTWLVALQFLDTLTSVTKYLLMSFSVNHLINYYTNQILYTLLFVFIIFKICNYFGRKELDNRTARKIFVVAVATFFSFEILQFIISMFCYQFIGEIYFSKLISYKQNLDAAANVLQVRYFNIGSEIFRYISLALIIMRKANCYDDLF